MQTAATTSHAALTASPLLSATIANATAPKKAIAIHKILFCGALELLVALMDVLPHCRKSLSKPSFVPARILIKTKVFGQHPVPSPGCYLPGRLYDGILA